MTLPRKPSSTEILQLFRTAGFDSPAPLQEQLYKAIGSGKDVLADAEAGSSGIAGILAPLMLGLRGQRIGLHALILTPDVVSIGDLSREYVKFSRAMRDSPQLLTLGETEDTRREQRRLEAVPPIVAGTVERVIDHIRRGSVSFARLSILVVEVPAEAERAEDFAKDVQFITEKLPQNRQTVILGRPAPGIGLLELLRRPAEVRTAVEEAAVPGESVYYEVGAEDKAGLLVRILLARRVSSALVFHSGRTDANALVRRASSCWIRAAALKPGTGPVLRKKLFSSFLRREAQVLFIQSPAPPECDSLRAACRIYYDLPPARPEPFGRGESGVMALVDGSQAREFAKFQDFGVVMKKENNPGEAEAVRGSLERIIRTIKEDEDLDRLTRLRTIIRKEVPLFMRTYLAAYLLKSALPGTPSPEPAAGLETRARQRERIRHGREQERQAPPRGGRGREPGPPAPQRTPEPGRDSKFTQLFVSIGRNRRVYPKDLSGFFTESLGLGAEEIGVVRVFDKYSFVEIAPGRAAAAIEKLSGAQFKGRPITVNFAKKKEEKNGR
jgi:ATP-dependent RNA helicase DeaD